MYFLVILSRLWEKDSTKINRSFTLVVVGCKFSSVAHVAVPAPKEQLCSVAALFLPEHTV